jgi:HAD superfamily hydrolase (TIGR01549 family)
MTHGINYYRDNFSMNVEKFVDRFTKYEDEIDEANIFPFPYAREICREIIDMGGRNFILTHRGKSIYKFLKHHNMLHLFTEIVTKEHGFKRKPDPEAFIYLVNKYNIGKDNALMVGDRVVDLAGAKNSGIKSCLFDVCNCDFRQQADYVIDSMKELEDILF